MALTQETTFSASIGVDEIEVEKSTEPKMRMCPNSTNCMLEIDFDLS